MIRFKITEKYLLKKYFFALDEGFQSDLQFSEYLIRLIDTINWYDIGAYFTITFYILLANATNARKRIWSKPPKQITADNQSILWLNTTASFSPNNHFSNQNWLKFPYRSWYVWRGYCSGSWWKRRKVTRECFC